MEAINEQKSSPAAQPEAVDYAAALRQYHRYGRGRSMKKFCEDEGYDYAKFCRLAREGQLEMSSRTGATDKQSGFIEVKPDGTLSQVMPEEPLEVCEIKIRFNNGLILSRKGGNVEEVMSAIHKILRVSVHFSALPSE